MKTLEEIKSPLQRIFVFLNQKLNGLISVESAEYVLRFNNEMGKGTIKGIPFRGGNSFLTFDVNFREKFEVQTAPAMAESLFLGYCSEGHVNYRFEGSKEEAQVETFQTVILNSETDKDLQITFMKEVETYASLILVDKTASPDSEEMDFNTQLIDLFSEPEKDQDFLYIGSYNLRIAEQLERIRDLEETGVVRKIMMEGIVNLILAMELKQHARDVDQQLNSTGSLTSREMGIVREISNVIKSNPEFPFSITGLCKEYGIAAPKVQEGFKLLHGTTVGDTIKMIRVEKAEELIRTTDLNISEVVYSVGLSSRSYFSKIFKERYKCSPKNYKSHQYQLVAS